MKEEILVICYNMYAPGGLSDISDISQIESQTNHCFFYIWNLKTNKVKLTEYSGCWGLRGGRNSIGKTYKLPIKTIKSEKLMYNMVMIAGNTILYN